MAKMGRPRKEINQEEFEKLCGLQCTKEEICQWLQATDKTIDRWAKEVYDMTFSEVFAEKRGVGKIALRRIQMQTAKKSPAMAIFLGKNYLNQSDKQEIKHSGGVELGKLSDKELDDRLKSLMKSNESD